jgi:hypothetical protein
MDAVAGFIDTVLRAIGTPAEAETLASTKKQANALMARFPLPY